MGIESVRSFEIISKLNCVFLFQDDNLIEGCRMPVRMLQNEEWRKYLLDLLLFVHTLH